MRRALVPLLLLVLAAKAFPAADLQSAGRNYFGDVVVVNQNGEKMRLYSDLIAGKTVVINSFYSTCSGICPIMTSTLQKVQKAVGDRLGRDVVLISVSVDPETDTPARLHDYAARVSAKRGWYFVTGERKSVEEALHKLGLSTDVKENHKALVIIGNEPKGVWKKAFGLAGSDDVVRLVEQVIAAE